LQRSCTLEFDGASSGNPGRSGAGAVLRSADGSRVNILSIKSFLHNTIYQM